MVVVLKVAGEVALQDNDGSGRPTFLVIGSSQMVSPKTENVMF